MRNFGYNVTKWWIKTGLHLYFGKIKVYGLENVPKNKPVLFLPNHQSALLDVLLIAVDCNRKPYFLTRSDVFNGKFLNAVFAYFQMIPIYRIRDGRESLKNNQAVFDRCSKLLIQKEAILMFPEANHNLKRRVRPLSKGFTRILFNTLDIAPETDIHIVPVGINYRDAVSFPDKVALYFDTPIEVKEMYSPSNERESIARIKEAVSSRLEKLTTHIEDEENYEEIIEELDSLGVDYLQPKVVNTILQNSTFLPEKSKREWSFFTLMGKLLFTIFNLPVIVLWRIFAKPKVWEPELMGTLRFAFSLFAYPLYYGIAFTGLTLVANITIGLVGVIGLFVFNWIYVRLG